MPRKLSGYAWLTRPTLGERVAWAEISHPHHLVDIAAAQLHPILTPEISRQRTGELERS